MFIFRYDKTFEGLLTAVFDAYSMKKFPDMLLAEEEPPPLFYDEIYTVVTDEERSNRVWNGLQKKLSASGLASLSTCWLSELPGIDMFLFQRDLARASLPARPLCRSKMVALRPQTGIWLLL